MAQQTMTARKRKRAAKRKKKQANVRLQREMAKRPSLRNDLELFQGGQDTKLRAVGRVCGTLWKNQEELTAAHHQLDTQQFVLARLLVPIVNDILVRIGSDDLITLESIGRCFLEWDEFKKRPDYKDLLPEWLLGKPLSELPPPKVKEKEQLEKAPAESEGPQEFGGDYVERQTSGLGDETDPEEQPEGQSDGKEDEMSEGQDADETPHAEG